VLTTRRVVAKRGLLHRRNFELVLDRVEGLGVERTIVDRLLGTGTILVSGTGVGRQRMRCMARPYAFREARADATVGRLTTAGHDPAATVGRRRWSTNDAQNGSGTLSSVPKKQRWKDEPDDHDYPAAADYLSLLVADKVAARAVKRLRTAPIIHRKAKDLLRASGLSVLPVDDVHVAKDLTKIRKAERLSPVLLVRGDASSGRPLLIADGYHRVCASYHVDEDADIPCRAVDLPERR